MVVATGGGALANAEAMDLALASGTVVYLAASVDTILARTASEETERPLLKAREKGSELERYVVRLLEERLPQYRRAHLVAVVDHRQPREIADEIRRRLLATT